MRVPVEWLTEYVDLGGDIENVADTLTMAGLEVEEIGHMGPAELVHGGGAPLDGEDRIFVTKVTPNRGDWLSMIGVAREISAVTGKPLKMPEAKAAGTGPESGSLIKIGIVAPDLCKRYVGIVVRNVKIKDSPDWMKNRLIRAGMRPINNIVDITNYVMLELGQPLHAFDCDLLKGREIIVRRARKGETITSIDSVERKLQENMLVIADRDRAVAIAGVMGGFDSEVSPNTKTILIESANFDAVSIRRTSKALSMTTESSYRFERGVDPGITDLAARRAAELMRDLGDGEICVGMVDVFPGKAEPKAIEVRPERVNRLLGMELETDEMVRCLTALGFSAELKDKIFVRVPTWRPDIEREADLIEEIARIHGYENIGSTLPSAPVQGRDSEYGAFTRRLRHILMSSGLQEVLTHSLTDVRSVEISGFADRALSVRNPLSEETSRVRTSLAPNLLQAVARNQSVGTKDIAVFEIGKVYRGSDGGQIDEFGSAAGAIVGNLLVHGWNLSKEALAADFFLAKGAVESMLDGLGISGAAFSPTEHPLLHSTRAAKIEVDGHEIGIVGEVSPEVRESLELRGRPYVFEIDAYRLMSLVPHTLGYAPLPRFPALHRHLAVVLEREVPYSVVCRSIVESGGEIVEDVDLLDIYSGPQVGETERSLTLSIVFRSIDRTLTDDEVNAVMDRIVSTLKSKFNASIRG